MDGHSQKIMDPVCWGGSIKRPEFNFQWMHNMIMAGHRPSKWKKTVQANWDHCNIKTTPKPLFLSTTRQNHR